jgi:hypothetical protein
MNNRGQALVEILVLFPAIILVGCLVTEGARLIALKGILMSAATNIAENMSASELLDDASDEVSTAEKGEHSVDLRRMETEGDFFKSLVKPHSRLFGWVPSQTFPVRIYATHHQNLHSAGFSVQINACIPLIASLIFSGNESRSSSSRDCLGQFQPSPNSMPIKGGNVRIRVAAFVPRMASFHIFHSGIPPPKTWKGLDRIPGDILSGSEKSSNKASDRIAEALRKNTL